MGLSALNSRRRNWLRLTTMTVSYLRLSSAVVTFGCVWRVLATKVRDAVVDVMAAPIWRCSCEAETASPSTPGIVSTPVASIFTLASLAGRSTDLRTLSMRRMTAASEYWTVGRRSSLIRSPDERAPRAREDVARPAARQRLVDHGAEVGAQARLARAELPRLGGVVDDDRLLERLEDLALEPRPRLVGRQPAQRHAPDLDPGRDLVRPRVVVGVQRAP